MDKKNIGKGEEVFKIGEDGTIIKTEGQSTQAQKTKGKKWLWLFLIIPVFLLGVWIHSVIEENHYREIREQEIREEKHYHEISRPITQRIYELTRADKVYWTTEGVGVTLHLYSDCQEFHNMPVSQGRVTDAVRYYTE
jgi:hypothetical protein